MLFTDYNLAGCYKNNFMMMVDLLLLLVVMRFILPCQPGSFGGSVVFSCCFFFHVRDGNSCPVAMMDQHGVGVGIIGFDHNWKG
jgi:hypothetical protein